MWASLARVRLYLYLYLKVVGVHCIQNGCHLSKNTEQHQISPHYNNAVKQHTGHESWRNDHQR